MTQIYAYLTFNGNCREAMEFYNSCIGGKLDIMDFGSSPGSENVAEDEKKLVMHAKLQKDELILMASDTTDRHGKVTTGSSISLSLDCTSEDEIREVFDKLSEGGTITMPLEDTFWGAKFGMFNDKFGIPWMLNYDKPNQ
jgi:PhnB protein